jgi:hypothetical protein
MSNTATAAIPVLVTREQDHKGVPASALYLTEAE